MKVYVLLDLNFDDDQIEGVITSEAVAREWKLGDMGFDYKSYELDDKGLVSRIVANDGPLRERNQQRRDAHGGREG